MPSEPGIVPHPRPVSQVQGGLRGRLEVRLGWGPVNELIANVRLPEPLRRRCHERKRGRRSSSASN